MKKTIEKNASLNTKAKKHAYIDKLTNTLKKLKSGMTDPMVIDLVDYMIYGMEDMKKTSDLELFLCFLE